MRIKTDVYLSADEISNSISDKTCRKNNFQYFNYFTTDSREAQSADLFISLCSDKDEEEKYLKEAKSKGAFTLSSNHCYADFYTQDVYLAFLKIAELYKSKLIKLKKTIAITGSLGKTTTKEFCAYILKNKYVVHSTYGNYNNILGVAFTVLSAPINTEILILEIGMNHAGEISIISKGIEPDIALITNVDICHIENFKSRKDIAKAKLEICDGMRLNELIVPYEEELLEGFGKYTFSIKNKNADFFMDSEIYEHKLYHNDDILEFTLDLRADYRKKALLSAISIAKLLNFSDKELIDSLMGLKEIKLRQRFVNFDKFTIYDDSYSSSPEAIRADLEFLKNSYPDKTIAVILGDMLELGEISDKLHEYAGELAAEFSCSKIFAFGNYAEKIKYGALKSGFKNEDIFINADFISPEITAEQVLKNCNNGEIILLKASRKMRAERILEKLKEKINVR